MTKLNMTTIGLSLMFLLGGCGGNGTGRDGESQAHAEADDHATEATEVVTLSPEAIEASGIASDTAGPRALSVTTQLPGEVAPNADRLAHIVPRFPGIVREVRKNLGDEVGAGEVLAIIESNESLSPYQVTSLMSGTIIEKHITLGEFVRDDTDVFVVADLSTVWVNVTVYAKDLDRIRRGQKVVITAVGGAPAASGVFDYVAPVLGETSRAAIARVVLPNPGQKWRPGAFVTAQAVLEEVTVPVAVRDGAVQNVEGHSVVFVEGSDGFHARPVSVGRGDGEWTEITQDLAAGEAYVANGSFILKSELLKSKTGHGH